jgi:muramoyltetrapeptide carboxypeptidase
MKKLKCQALTAGAKIGVVAPASPVQSAEQIEQAVSRLAAGGYSVTRGVTAVPMTGDLAGTDYIRQTDLERFWQDETIQAIWCLRGGYGSLRLLPHLWFGLMAKHPKLLIGFSDITALELGIWSQVKLITFHGPVLTSMNSEFTQTQAFNNLRGMVQGQGHLTGLEWPGDSLARYIPIRGGRAQGIMLGGNLTTLTSLLGTRFLPDFEGVILFLEEVGEPAYRIDRMLTQLAMSGILNMAAAVLVGCCIPTFDETEDALVAVFREKLRVLSCPSGYGFPWGHIPNQWTIPQGVLAEVDTEKGTLVLLENPVK